MLKVLLSSLTYFIFENVGWTNISVGPIRELALRGTRHTDVPQQLALRDKPLSANLHYFVESGFIEKS